MRMMAGQWGTLGLLTLIAANVAAADSSIARADQASDLRADEALLQSRVDRQAQLPSSGDLYGVGPGNPATMAPATSGSFPRSVLIPGTETSLRVGGQIDEIAAYWFTGGQPNVSPFSFSPGGTGLLQTMPLNGSRGYARGNGIFGQSPAASRISFRTSTPSAWGEVRTHIEFDWAGSTPFLPGGANPTSVSDDLVPRLRYAYGTVGGWLFGQANSNFRDADADSELIDFGGDVGGPGIIRIPQVRYTASTGLWDSELSISAEAPETDLGTPTGIVANEIGFPTAITSCLIVALRSSTACSTALTNGPTIAKATAPTVVADWFVRQPWGHFDLAVVAQPGLDVNDGKFVSRQFVGYGGQVSGVFRPGWMGWAKDNFHWHFTIGTGIGTYVNGGPTFALATNYTGLPASPAAALAVRIKPVNEIGWTVGYQHYWSPEWRSTASVGFYHMDIPGQIIGVAELINLNKQLETAHLNLFWSPVSMVDIGVEYMFGRALAPVNRSGNENVMLSEFRFRF
jgi:hypothetical protein